MVKQDSCILLQLLGSRTTTVYSVSSTFCSMHVELISSWLVITFYLACPSLKADSLLVLSPIICKDYNRRLNHMA